MIILFIRGKKIQSYGHMWESDLLNLTSCSTFGSGDCDQAIVKLGFKFGLWLSHSKSFILFF